jgi:hypothetical protein
MENLKIKVESNEDIKKSQEFFYRLGYKWAVGDKENKAINECPTIIRTHRSGCMTWSISSEVMYKNHKEITMQELYDMVVLKCNCESDATHENLMYKYVELSDGWYYFDKGETNKWLKSTGAKASFYEKLKPITKAKKMKEFLNPDQNYELVTCGVGKIDIPENLIEVPDGADTYIQGVKYPSRFGFLKVKDNVNNPSHYASGNIECIDAMISAYGVEAVKAFCKCNAFKYQWRFDKKNGDEDIKKAQWYQNKYMELNNAKE